MNTDKLKICGYLLMFDYILMFGQGGIFFPCCVCAFKRDGPDEIPTLVISL